MLHCEVFLIFWASYGGVHKNQTFKTFYPVRLLPNSGQTGAWALQVTTLRRQCVCCCGELNWHPAKRPKHNWRSWKEFVKWNKRQAAALKWFCFSIFFFSKVCFSLCALALTIPSCLHISHASVQLICTDIFLHSSHELGLGCLSQRRPLSLFGGLLVTPDSGWASTSKMSLLHTMELSQWGSRTRPLCRVVSEVSCDALTMKPVTSFLKWHSVSISVCVWTMTYINSLNTSFSLTTILFRIHWILVLSLKELLTFWSICELRPVNLSEPLAIKWTQVNRRTYTVVDIKTAAEPGQSSGCLQAVLSFSPRCNYNSNWYWLHAEQAPAADLVSAPERVLFPTIWAICLILSLFVFIFQGNLPFTHDMCKSPF